MLTKKKHPPDAEDMRQGDVAEAEQRLAEIDARLEEIDAELAEIAEADKAEAELSVHIEPRSWRWNQLPPARQRAIRRFWLRKERKT